LLRVTDVLTRNLIKAALTHDLNNCTSLSATYDINSGKMIKDLVQCIKDCGVTFSITACTKKNSENDGQFEFTSLMGKDKMKVLERLPDKFYKCQPEGFYKTVEKLWKV